MTFSDLRSFLNLLPIPALVVDTRGALVFASTSAQVMLGHETSELRGEPVSRWLTVPAAEEHSGNDGSPLRAADVAGFRTLREASGESRIVEVIASDLTEVEPRGILLLVHGLRPQRVGNADQVELAEALLRNEQRLRHATQAAQVGIFDHPILVMPPEPPYWSPTLRSMLGVSQDSDTDFMWFRSRVHPEDAVALDAAIAEASAPGRDGSIELEYRWDHPEKGQRWLFNRSVTEFQDLNGHRVPLRSIGAILDVTDRRAAEQQQQLRAAILDATPDFVAISVVDGRLIYLNKAARSFLGLGLGDSLEGRKLDEVHPPAIAKVMHSIAIPAAVARGSWSAETEFLRRDGTAVPMSHVVLAQRDSTGQGIYLCTIARDLSKERALEEQFRQAQKMEAIGRLAGGVAHDFNNLLSVILGYADIAATEVSRGGDALRPLKEIVGAAERAAALTSQLLAFGRRQILKPRVLDINEVLTDFTPMVRRLIDERIQLHVIPSSHSANVRADPVQVQQVLLNLVVNARDAMPVGGVLTIEALRVTFEERQAGVKLNLAVGTYAVIAVSDTGHGMDAATRERIFEPFFTTKGPGKGTGLGLATVFGIVEQSGGSIWVYSEPGRGTTFKIYLPSTDEPADAPLPPPPRVDVARGGVILLSEDDEQVRNMVCNILLRAGYEVLPAGTPEQAIELSARHPGRIDLLLTDVVMPGMTGIALAERLHEARPELPVLFTSGYTENTVVHQGVLDDGVAFLPKPITPGRLLTAVYQILNARPRPQASAYPRTTAPIIPD